MSTSPITPDLIMACIESRPFAWQTFVDQSAQVVMESIRSLGKSTGRQWTDEEVAELSKKVFESLRADNFELLRGFDPKMNAETFLTVAVRRAVLASNPAIS